MPGLAYGGRHCDTSFIFVVDVMKQKEKPVKNYKMLEPARKLRREMTPQERKLWYAFLKDYPVKIYKQRIIESYIVDFYCAKAGLVIELDGPIHKHEQNIQHDTNRDERLKSYGLEILRIPNTKIDSDFGQVCAYIDAHYREEIHREELGELVFLNTDYLSRIFKKEKGISISNYIIQKRVEEAKKLLTQSTLPINTVSLYVGYSNFSYFTKMFKDNTGYAPLEYRRSFSEK